MGEDEEEEETPGINDADLAVAPVELRNPFKKNDIGAEHHNPFA